MTRPGRLLRSKSQDVSRGNRVMRQAVRQKAAAPSAHNRLTKDYTTDTMASERQATVDLVTEIPTVAFSARPRGNSEASIDIALLVCALFLQRFSLSFGNSLMSLDVVPAVLILIYQFAAGRLVIVYDRLLSFLALGFVATWSLWLNFKRPMLSSYSEFVLMYFLLTLSRPATSSRYKRTLQGFQFLVLVLSFLAIAQFFAQFVLDGRQLIQFYGIVPDYLLASFSTGGVNTIIPMTEGSSLIKSNGIFLTEPSTLSQITALGILIELLEFRRLRYLLPLVCGFLLSYSGTGLMMLLLCLPLSGLFRRGTIFYLLMTVLFVFGLWITGIVDLSVLVSRAGEFEDTRASGFARFVGPFWLAADSLHLASLRGLLLGNGPGTTAAFADAFWYSGGVTATWTKLLYEYGLIGSFIFVLFLATCFRQTLCPGLLLTAVVFSYVFLGGNLLSTPFLIMTIVLVTLNAPEARRDRIGTKSRFHTSLIAG